MREIYKKLENYMENLPKNQYIMLYLIVLLAIGSALYNYIPDMRDKNELLKGEVQTLKNDIKRSSIKKLKRALKTNQKIVLKKKKEYRELRQKTMYVLSELYSLKFAFFDEKEWINTLYNILKKSVAYNVEIKYVKNSKSDKVSKSFSLVKIKKSIFVEAKGNFKDIVRYINYIESLPALLRFETIEFSAQKDGVKVVLMFDAYGIGI